MTPLRQPGIFCSKSQQMNNLRTQMSMKSDNDLKNLQPKAYIAKFQSRKCRSQVHQWISQRLAAQWRGQNIHYKGSASVMTMMFRARPQIWTGTTSTWWCGCGPSATRSSATTTRASSSSRERGRYGSVSDYSMSTWVLLFNGNLISGWWGKGSS